MAAKGTFFARKPPWLAASLVFILFVALAILCYCRTLNGGFEADDWWWCQNAKNFGLLGNDHSHAAGLGMFYRPVLSVAFGLLWQAFGPNPAPYRLFNLLLLAATASSLFSLWRRLSPEKGGWEALAVGALFVVWPTHVETTVWIAGMTDGLAVAFGSWALFAFVAYRQESRKALLAVSIILLLLAMFSKESAVVLPLLCLPVGWIAVKPRPRWRAVAIDGSILLLVTLVYLVLRSLAIGRLVGGYGGVSASNLNNNLSVNLANAYLPFGKWIALWWGFEPVKFSLKLISVGAAAFALRKLPRTSEPTRYRNRVIIPLLTCGLAWVLIASLGSNVLKNLHSQFGAHPIYWLACILILLMVGHLIRRDRAALSALGVRLVPRERLSYLAVLATLYTVSLALIGVSAWQETLLFGVYLWVVFETRDPDVPALNAYLLTACVFFTASLIAILPSLPLPIGMDGQQSRFSYLPTILAIPAIYSVLSFFFRIKRERLTIAVWTIAVLYLVLMANLLPWILAGQISQNSAETIGRLLPARRIYVLAAPGMVGSANLFVGGLDRVGNVAAGDRSVAIKPAIIVHNFDEGDEIHLSLIGPGLFRFGLKVHEGLRYNNPSFSFESESDMFSISEGMGGHLIRLKGWEPSDRVIFIDGDGAHELR